MRKILCSVFVLCSLGVGSFGEEEMTLDKLVEELASVEEKLASFEEMTLDELVEESNSIEAISFDKAVEESASIEELRLQKAVKLFVASISGIQKPEGDPTQQDIDNVIELVKDARDIIAYLDMNQYRNPEIFEWYVQLIQPLFREAIVNIGWINDLPTKAENKVLLLLARELLKMGLEVERGYFIPVRSCTKYQKTSEITAKDEEV